MKKARPRKFLFYILKFLFCKAICAHYGFRGKKYRPKSDHFIMISNHVTDVDFLCMPSSLPCHYYYVASDNIGRGRKLHDLLTYLIDPIWRKKSTNDITTVYNVLKRVKSGENVCIFGEGGRSISGRTLPVVAATGKLVKASGAALITYRIRGGYFIQPRWAKKFRKGKFFGEVVNEYSADEIAQMSPEEVQEVIERDIYEDAYAYQRDARLTYKGDNIAESIEVALYMCPICKKLSAITSKGDTFECTNCHTHFRYTEQGFIESDRDTFDNITDWYEWQKDEIRSRKELYSSYQENDPITQDFSQDLTILSDKDGDEVINGMVSAFRDRLEFHAKDGRDFTFDYNDFSDADVINRQGLIFSIKGRGSYVLSSETVNTSPFKYIELIYMLRTDGRTVHTV